LDTRPSFKRAVRFGAHCIRSSTLGVLATVSIVIDVLIERAHESLRAAQLCLEAEFVNSAVRRAYYAMFQAAQVALEAAGARRAQWSHPTLQAFFTTELIHRRKVYPAAIRDHLSAGLRVRQVADYGATGVSRIVAHRMVRRAATFVSIVQEGTRHGPTT
jgi:uncharacterized protein (UPF0332 family)